MANIAAYYRLNVPISIGGLTTGAVNEVRNFDDWTAILFPGQPDELARVIDTYTLANGHPVDWFTLDSAPSTADRYVLADGADTVAGTLLDKSDAGTGIVHSIVTVGGVRKVRTTATGSPGVGTNTAHFRNTDGTTLNMDGSRKDIPFATTVTLTGGLTMVGAEVTFTIAGSWWVVCAMTPASTTAEQVRKRVWAMVDNGGGYTDFEATSVHHPDFLNDEHTGHLIFPLIVSAGTKLKFQAATDGGVGASTPALATFGCRLSLFRFDPPSINSMTRAAVADAAYPASAGNQLIAYTSLTAPRTVTLPAAAGWAGMVIRVKDEAGAAGTHTITIDGNGAETVDGAASVTITTNHGSKTLYSNGVAVFTI